MKKNSNPLKVWLIILAVVFLAAFLIQGDKSKYDYDQDQVVTRNEYIKGKYGELKTLTDNIFNGLFSLLGLDNDNKDSETVETPAPSSEPKVVWIDDDTLNAIEEKLTKRDDDKSLDVYEKVTLERVVDGDTIVVKNVDGEKIKVRLIGIDTPESVHADESKNTKEGVEASNYTKSLLEDTEELYLQYDEEPEDPYGRTLAYVWFADDKGEDRDAIELYMLNGILLKEGYAINKEFPPNTKYAEVFRQICEEAEANKRGLWSPD